MVLDRKIVGMKLLWYKITKAQPYKIDGTKLLVTSVVIHDIILSIDFILLWTKVKI